jgi:transmembrane sensor
VGDAPSESEIEAEAAAWFTRLNAYKIDLKAVAAFHAWRRRPEHDAAYERVQEVWKAAGAVRDDPAVIAALREAKARIAETRRKEGLPLPLVVSCGFLAVLGGGAVLLAITSGPAPQRLETAVGQERQVRLADGTSVELDTATRIEVRFSRREREVRLLAGQALFDVAHRADWPFHVSTQGVDVRDLGTRFDVRAGPESLAVTVVQGVVNVSAPALAHSWRVTAGQTLTPGPAATPHPVDAMAAIRWTTGRLEFENTSLADAAREMNRYARHPLVLRGAAVEALRVSGAFDAANTQAFASTLASVYGLAETAQPDGSLVLTATNPPPTT